MDERNILKRLAQLIFDKKGKHIVAIDVQGVCSMVKFILIAEGNVDRHLIALAKEVDHMLREEGGKGARIEGMEKGDWIVLDCFELMIHLFLPEMRKKYQLEELWSAGKVIDLEISSSLPGAFVT